MQYFEDVAITKKLITTYTTPQGTEVVVESFDDDEGQFSLSTFDRRTIFFILENEQYLKERSKRIIDSLQKNGEEVDAR